jgi:hypothetical protein
MFSSVYTELSVHSRRDECQRLFDINEARYNLKMLDARPRSSDDGPRHALALHAG